MTRTMRIPQGPVRGAVRPRKARIAILVGDETSHVKETTGLGPVGRNDFVGRIVGNFRPLAGASRHTRSI